MPQGIPTDVKKTLTKAMKQAARAKAMIAEGEADYKEAKEIILPIMAAYDLESHVIKGVGTAKARVNRGSSINSKKLREALLLQNMDPDQINEVVESSSTKWATEYLEFKPVWEGK